MKDGAPENFVVIWTHGHICGGIVKKKKAAKREKEPVGLLCQD